MKIGLISDTHDNIQMIKKAVEVFNQAETGLVLHAGDYVAPFSIDAMRLLFCPFKGVFGNNDGDKAALKKKSRDAIVEGPLQLEVDGKKIFIVHDLDSANLDAKRFDIILSGHTHKLNIEDRDGTLYVNPGECGGWLYGHSTIVILNTVDMVANTIELKT